jgi:hypothetical protein
MKVELHKSSKDMARQSDVLLVLGDGDSMPKDRDTFLAWGIKHDCGALGRGIKAYPGYVRHWFCGDGDTSIWWAKNLINGDGTVRHCMGEVDGFDVDWDLKQPDYNYCTITGETNVGRMHGSSAMFGTLVGLELGYSKIVLAGCPLDMNGHWYFENKTKETLGPIWLGVDFMAWIDFKEQKEAQKVRSMSGYTAKILGVADREWLNEMC